MDTHIAIGSDHAGFQYKAEIIKFLEDKQFIVKDFGTYSEASTDYADFAHPLAESIANKQYEKGILICGSGNGVAITANKHAGVRAALCWSEEIVALARQHNNANVLCLPARFISLEEAKKFVETFLDTAFEGGRHERRVAKIDACAVA
ncbi:ribose 5-phosphate isomerase B [Thermoflexibacter ruber]|uniref:Ribose 5-phosphate isomerase B n=1 Tax=Thermoflexibacter ruber TaxID=1003 RepID=A0A1I2GQN8_9BACT|nr:ribose 5-phosphate isomerase B [Thermoflexibacter ruber]SFF18966.1 ribose 5-phosphate isomerase B [Thermoflexibacter ruber]